MGSKSQPSKFDCYANAEPDEPMFVLLGRDPAAPILINLWADIRARMGEEQEKVEEANDCSKACYEWLLEKGKRDKYVEALDIVLDELKNEELVVKIDRLKELVRQLCSALGTSDQEEELRRVAADFLEEGT